MDFLKSHSKKTLTFLAFLLQLCCTACFCSEFGVNSKVYLLLWKKFFRLEKLPNHVQVQSVLSQCLLASRMRRCGVKFEFYHQKSTPAGLSDRGPLSDSRLRCCTKELHPAGSWRCCLAAPITSSRWTLRLWAYKFVATVCSFQVQ